MLETEIRQQPAVLEARAAEGMRAARAAASLLRRDSSHVLLAARGSSDNAARFAQYLWGRRLGLATYLAAPSLYAEDRPPDLVGAAVVGVSQSGQSPDIVAVLNAARRQGRPTIAVTNDPASPLAAGSDVVVPLLAGRERSVAATKTYLATLHAVAQLAVALGADDLVDDLHRMPEVLDQVVGQALGSPVAGIGAAGSGKLDALTVVGRGTGFATAAEMALKIREVAGVRAEGFAVPDLLHGPIAATGAGSNAWVVCSPGRPPGYWGEVVSQLSANGVAVTAVQQDGDPEMATRIRMPGGLPAWLFDAVAVVHGQVAALRLGEATVGDVDHPRGLRKVTLTR